MGKLFRFIFTIILLAAIVVFACYFLRKSILTSILSRELGVKTTIESFTISNNELLIKGLTVGNVKKGTLPYSLKVDTIRFVAPIRNYFHKKILISKIDLQKVDLNLEFLNKKLTQSNWGIIANNLLSGESAPKPEGRSAHIELLTVDPINVSTLSPGTEIKHFAPIENLSLKNLDTENGDISRRITYAIASQIVKKALIEQALQSPDKALEGLQRAFNF